jgi:uncharacterized protein (UPF0335 family)
LPETLACGVLPTLHLVTGGPAAMNDATPAADRSHSGGVAAERLRSFVQRIERLEEDKAGLAQDLKEVYAEARGEGFDVKVMRKLIGLRKRDPRQRREEDELLELYLSALGE